MHNTLQNVLHLHISKTEYMHHSETKVTTTSIITEIGSTMIPISIDTLGKIRARYI